MKDWKLLCLHGLGSCSCRSGLSLRSLVTAAWGASVSRDETATDDGDAMLARSRLEFARSADQTKENRDLEKESAATSPQAGKGGR